MVASLIKWSKGGLKNPMARARGLGSAHDGLHHWIMQRVTAVLLLPLTIWLACSIVNLIDADQAAFVAWLALPWNAVLMILSVMTFFYHAMLGCQVIIEDYIHNEAFKIFKLLSMQIVLFAAGLLCIFSILKVAL